MPFRDSENEEVSPEYMAGYIAYGQGVTENPFPFINVDNNDWSSEAIANRRISRRHNMWHNGNRDAKWDSDWRLRG